MIGKVVSQNEMKTRLKRFYLSLYLHYFEFICAFFIVDLQIGMELVGDNTNPRSCCFVFSLETVALASPLLFHCG